MQQTVRSCMLCGWSSCCHHLAVDLSVLCSSYCHAVVCCCIYYCLFLLFVALCCCSLESKVFGEVLFAEVRIFAPVAFPAWKHNSVWEMIYSATYVAE